jgi:hypothetical protein
VKWIKQAVTDLQLYWLRNVLAWHVLSSDVSHNDVSGTIARTLGNLANLQSLYVTGATNSIASQRERELTTKMQMYIATTHTNMQRYAMESNHWQHSNVDCIADKPAVHVCDWLADWSWVRLELWVVVELNMRLPVHYRNMSHNQLQGNLADIDGLAQFEEILGQGTALAYNLFTCPLPQWAMYATPCVSSMERNSYDTHNNADKRLLNWPQSGCIALHWNGLGHIKFGQHRPSAT